MKAKGVFSAIFCGILIAGFTLAMQNENHNIIQSENTSSTLVFDALQYKMQDGKNISEAELIAQLGEPDRIEEWNDTTSDGKSNPIRTLYYCKTENSCNTEYLFHNDILHNITICDRIPYRNKKDFLPMFHLKKYADTTIDDTDFSYHAYNCGVPDVWIEYDEEEIGMVKISYSS